MSTVGQGEAVTIPIRAAHRWWNAGQDELRVRMDLRPALDTETFFETFFGLARDGKTKARNKGVPGLLQIALGIRAWLASRPSDDPAPAGAFA